jgi:hypothetical protein
VIPSNVSDPTPPTSSVAQRQGKVDGAVNRLALYGAGSAGAVRLPELGLVQVRTRTLAGSVSVELHADRAATVDLLRQERHALALHVREAQVPVWNVTVNDARRGSASAPSSTASEPSTTTSSDEGAAHGSFQGRSQGERHASEERRPQAPPKRVRFVL